MSPRLAHALAGVCFALGTLSAGTALAQDVTVPGERISPPIPHRYQLVSYRVGFSGGVGYIDITGEGDCHWQHRERCYFTGQPPRRVCYPDPEWVCYTIGARYKLPGTVSLEGKKVLFAHEGGSIEIGTVKSFLFWKWVELNDRARVDATHETASLQINVNAPLALSESLPRENFDALYGNEVNMALLVSFNSDVSNQEARKIVADYGYMGGFAPTNDGSSLDPNPHTLGLKVSLTDARVLLSRLQGDHRVLEITPAN